jgi:squalene-hopene/tetraprenyl-beta-curcumene cyclase
LLSRREPGGGWRGRLSDSPLATAVAVVTLAVIDRERHAAAIGRGVDWLASVQHGDGGWGDADRDPANLSATVLAWAACGFDPDGGTIPASRAAEWLLNHAGGVAPEQLVNAVLARYGDDRTFSAPILTLLAIAGKLGPAPGCWEAIPQLPFELAALPRWTFRLARLEVVSYALPALIAVGLARHRARPADCFCKKLIRNGLSTGLLQKLAVIQPASGGFLEATPLTGFVALSLAAAGHGGHPVVSRAVDFLLSQQRPAGSWPVDADLSQWCTTLALKALAGEGGTAVGVPDGAVCEIRNWLLGNQMKKRHPYTGAASGGWAWTDRPGGVPDVDDTAGVLLALRRLSASSGAQPEWCIQAGIRWLLAVQNADGGWPTFCRGWGRLPFDRSCADLTAHALRALHAWRGDLPPRMRRRADRAIDRGMAYLRTSQRADGAWLPLWFGNPAAPDQANPVYGTVQVLVVLQETGLDPEMRRRGAAWLRQAQAPDGGWGGARDVVPSVEETALAVHALAGEGDVDAVRRGYVWLKQATEEFSRFPAAPIGLYFASLWYDEELYPLIFTVAALGRVAACVPWRRLELAEVARPDPA